MTSTSKKVRPVIGRATFIAFPEFGLELVPAKTDTGAYRSAIHAANVKVVEKDGVDTLSFDVLQGHRSAGQKAHFETSEFREVYVANSFGHREKRYEVMALCLLEGKRFRTSFTLADRSKKIYPVLMGRRLLNRRFIIDTTISHIDRKVLKKKFNVSLPNDEEDN